MLYAVMVWCACWAVSWYVIKIWVHFETWAVFGKDKRLSKPGDIEDVTQDVNM